jgi:hypothetical protein
MKFVRFKSENAEVKTNHPRSAQRLLREALHATGGDEVSGIRQLFVATAARFYVASQALASNAVMSASGDMDQAETSDISAD